MADELVELNTDRRVAELCGNVDPQGVEMIRSWSVGYVMWKLLEMKARAGPKTGPHGAIMVHKHLGVADMPQCAVYDGNHEQRQRVRN